MRQKKEQLKEENYVTLCSSIRSFAWMNGVVLAKFVYTNGFMVMV